MVRWLKSLTAPTILLWLFALTYGIASGLVSDHAGLVSSILFPFLLAFWVVADARRRHRSLCYDFGTFVFFGWPVVVPVYLFQTRGTRAFLTLLYFVGLWIFTWFVTWTVSLIRQ